MSSEVGGGRVKGVVSAKALRQECVWYVLKTLGVQCGRDGWGWRSGEKKETENPHLRVVI